MRRRYTSARNPIEALRERWGLGDTAPSPIVPSGQGPSIGVHPLPLTPEQSPEPYSLPLPRFPGDVFSDHPAPSDSGSVDYEARQRSQLDEVPQGGAFEPVSVYPNWESRLEGMRDFLATLDGVENSGEGALITPVTFEFPPFFVPQGYTAFCKGFRFFFDPVPAGLTPRNTLLTLLVDGVIVPDYFNLPLGPFMASFQDTFVIASGGRGLSIRVEITDSLGDLDVETFKPIALLYGNLRPRTGEPETRDVGVRAPPPAPRPVVVVPPPEPPRPPPPAAPTTVRRMHSGRGAGGEGGNMRKRPI